MEPRSRICALVFVMALPIAGTCWGEQPAQQAPSAEQDVIIVKYGSLSVRSSQTAARIIIDGTDKGSADDIIESVVTGEHVISCKAGGKTVSGTFTIRKNETLRLEALFDEGKLVSFHEPVKMVQQEKKKPEPVKAEKVKKPAPEAKKAELKNPVEERRKHHLTVIRLDYDVTNEQKIRITHQHVESTTKVVVQKDTIGSYYRTKQGILLCDAGPCEMIWKATFLYTDETGKTDALLMNWRQVVFNGATPSGTSRRDLECCLNGQCWKMQDTTTTDITQEFDIGRYRLSWTKSYVVLRRSDIMNEIMTAGRSLADYQ